MKQSVVKFRTPHGEELTRQGSATTEAIINQAKEEFGSIEVIEESTGEMLSSEEGQKMEALIHALEAAKHNIQVVLSQIESVDDHRPLPRIKQPLQVAIDRIDTELGGLLNG